MAHSVLSSDLRSPLVKGFLSGLLDVRLRSHGMERSFPGMIDNLRRIVLAPPANCERFHVVFLDGRKQLLGGTTIGEGLQDALSLKLRELFKRALYLEARSLVLAHNHPSGDCRPSVYDTESTQRISTIAKSLEIELVDHLIFTDTCVYSMRKGDQL